MVFALILPLLLLIIEILGRKKVSNKIWNFCSVLFIVALSHALGSRCISCMVYDDYANVYLYQGKYLAVNGFDRFDSAVNGVTSEKFFYLIFYIVVNSLSEKYWLFGLSFFSILFLFIGLKSYFKAKDIIIILMISSIGLSTQLIRQYIGWSFLFMILTTFSKTKYKYLGVFFSYFIHHSAVVMYIKYFLSTLKLKKLAVILIIIILTFYFALDKILQIEYYSLDYIRSESIESEIFDYNRSFILRAICLIPLYFVVSGHLKNYILISVVLFFSLLNLPLVPVRFNLLILSHGIGLLLVFLLHKFDLQKSSLIYFCIFFVCLVKIYFYSNAGAAPLWNTYSVIF